MFSFNIDFSELFNLMKAMIAPLLPLIYLALAITIGFYLFEWLIDLIPVFLRKRKEKIDTVKERTEKAEIKTYGKKLTGREKELLWFYQRERGEI